MISVCGWTVLFHEEIPVWCLRNPLPGIIVLGHQKIASWLKSKQSGCWGIYRPGRAEEPSLPLKMPPPNWSHSYQAPGLPFLSAPFCSLFIFRWHHSLLSFYFILLSTKPLLDFPVLLTSPLCRMNPEFWEYALFHAHTSTTLIKSADVTSPLSWLFFAQLGIGADNRYEIDTWLYLTVFPYPPFLCSEQNHPDNQQLKNEQEEIIKERLAKVWFFFLHNSLFLSEKCFYSYYLWLYVLETIYHQNFCLYFHC